MAFLEQGLNTLINWGLTDIIIPFMLIFTIVFVVLKKVQIFREDKKSQIVIALVMALAVIIPHVTNSYPRGKDVVDIINTALPSVSVVLVAIVMLLIMVGIIGFELDANLGTWGSWWVLAAVGIIVYIFGVSAGWFGDRLPRWLSFSKDPATQAALIIILVFGLIVWFVTKDSSEKYLREIDEHGKRHYHEPKDYPPPGSRAREFFRRKYP
ncbi:hypothetical protein GOV04_01975 [Candidatus Woesearchaeota archaeon]|nr:hypothetical protein [Candidatus Woesearchaeota archaeon]